MCDCCRGSLFRGIVGASARKHNQFGEVLMDLTRFDFHAMRFAHSEAVKAMTAEEVGQYILLLCDAWLLQKDASLPDDVAYLTIVAKGKVSPRVLRQFPLVDTQWGSRRRNDVLYIEWNRVKERSESASERGIKGNEVRWSHPSAIAQQSLSNRLAINELSPNPIQSNPNQTESNQSNFRHISRRFRNAFGFKPGKREKEVQDYESICRIYGEDYVLEQFVIWAADNEWIKEKKAKFPLTAFYEELEEIKESNALKAAEPVAEILDTAAINESANAEVRTEVQKKLDEIESEKELYKDIPVDQF
jgi:uncharacterized protein YdaU (DUF1376 family)